MPQKIEDEFADVSGYGARYRRRNRKKGRCAQCRKPSDKFLCDDHRERLNALKRQVRAEGGHLPRATRQILATLGA